MTTNKIYIVDDDELYTELLVEVAESEGWEVYAFNNARDFLDQLPADDGDAVIVLDLVMPEMDGIEVIGDLAQRQSKLTLILSSGYNEQMLSSSKLLAEIRKLKVHTTLTKPIVIADFIDILNEIKQAS